MSTPRTKAVNFDAGSRLPVNCSPSQRRVGDAGSNSAPSSQRRLDAFHGIIRSSSEAQRDDESARMPAACGARASSAGGHVSRSSALLDSCSASYWARSVRRRRAWRAARDAFHIGQCWRACHSRASNRWPSTTSGTPGRKTYSAVRGSAARCAPRRNRSSSFAPKCGANGLPKRSSGGMSKT